MIWMPITNSVQPRITMLHAEKNHTGEFALYRTTTQIVMIMVIPVTAIMVIFPEVLLRLWTNNPVIAAHSAGILRLYAIGNALLAINALPLLLQFASGNLRMHVIGNVLFAVTYLPILVIATRSYGTVGSCWAWLGLNLISFLFWLPYIHKTFFYKNHLSWLGRDIGAIGGFCGLPATLLAYFVHWTGNRNTDIAILVACAALLFIMACAGSSLLRAGLWNTFVSKKADRESRIGL
jgi:O-antigen/teichoic acid export membrane protein